MASSGDHVAGQRAGLGGGELERADRPLGLDPGRLDRLGRLPGDDLGELVAALGEQAGGGVEHLGPLPPRQRAAGERGLARRHRAVDVVGSADGNPADLGAVERRRDGGRLGSTEPLAGERTVNVGVLATQADSERSLAGARPYSRMP